MKNTTFNTTFIGFFLVLVCAASTFALSPPANDYCADATEIYLGTTSFSTVDATTDGDVHSTCQHDGQTYNDIWYGFTAGCDGILVVSTCGLVDYDSDLVVYLGDDCNNLTLLGCNDDGEILGVDCANYSSYLEVPVYMGDRLMIRVGGWNSGDSGSGDILLDIVDIKGTSVSCPANNACADAIDIVEGDTYFTTHDATTDGPTHPTCETGSDGGDTVNDIWYRYSAPASGTLTISTCDQANYDTDLVAYSGTDCNNLFFLGCNDDFGNCLFYTSTLVIPVNAGEEYLLRVGGWDGSESGTGTLTLTLDASAVTWVGSPGGSWFDTANWSSGVLPTNAVDVEIDTSVVIDQLGATASQVTIQNGGHLAVGVGSATTGSLTTDFINVNTGGTLQLQNVTSSIVSSSIHIDGNLNWFGGTIECYSIYRPSNSINVGCNGFTATLILATGGYVNCDTLNICSEGSVITSGISYFTTTVYNSGYLEINGSVNSGIYNQFAGGSLKISLTEFEWYTSINGSLIELGGTLIAEVEGGVEVTDGEIYNIISGTIDTNTSFDEVIIQNAPPGTSFLLDINSTAVNLIASVDTVWFVDGDNTAGTGTSWATAFSTIQQALAIAANGEQIWVAEGTYTPGTLRSSTFDIPSGVTVYGGFDGTETSIEQREISSHPTFLSGNVNNTPATNDDAYHVVTYAPSEWFFAVIDGFTITRGAATGTGIDDNYGGGVFIQTGTLLIYNSSIDDNGADDRGGGIYVDTGSVYLIDSVVSNNEIVDMQNGGPGFDDWGGTGGGVYINNGGIVATNSNFNSNRANDGGGVAAMNSDSIFSNCVFSDNYCYYKGAGLYSNSGTLDVFDSLFDDNLATVGIVGTGSGGGIHAFSTATRIEDSIFTNNEAAYGGGVYFDEISITQVAFIDRCAFRLNTSLFGAGFYASDSGSNYSYIADSLFADNDGPTLHMSVDTSGSRVTNCTIVNNYNIGEKAALTGIISLQNSIVWGNRGVYDRGYYNQVNGPITIDTCLIENGTEWLPAGLTNQDPIFRSELGPDGIEHTGDENYRLLPSSIAIDFGDNWLFNYPSSEDLDGNPRFQDDPYTDDWDPLATPIIDLGCYEYTPVLSGESGYRIWNGGSYANFGTDASWLPANAPGASDIPYFSSREDIPLILLLEDHTVSQLEISQDFCTFGLLGNTLTLTESNYPSLLVGHHVGTSSAIAAFLDGQLVANKVDISGKSHGSVGINENASITSAEGVIVRDGAGFYGGGTLYGNLYCSGTLTHDSSHKSFPTIHGDVSLMDGSIAGLAGSGTILSSCTPIDGDLANGYSKITVDGNVELSGLLYLYQGQIPVSAGLSITLIESTQPITTQFDAIMSSGFGYADLVPIVSYTNNVNGPGGSVIVTFQTVSSLVSFGGEEQTGLDTLPADAKFADFNNDGYPDIALSLPDSPISNILVLINGGMSGSSWNGFTSSYQIPVGDTSAGLAVGDLDGDTYIDIVVTNTEDNTVSILENVIDTNLGTGFIKQTDIATNWYAPTVDTLPTDVAIGNFNTPTSIDLAVANSGDGKLAIINGPIFAASFMPSGSSYSTGGGANSVDPTDVNDTKDLDKVAVTGNGGKTSIFKSGSSGLGLVLEYGEPTVIEVGDGIAEQIIADLDNNGYDDLVVADPVGNSIDILLQTAEDVYASPLQLPVSGTNPESITSIDLDGDGDLDLVVVLTDISSVKLARAYRNDTELGTGEAIFTDVGYEQGAGELPLFARSADVDGDGADDLWLATATPPSFSGVEVGSTLTSLNNIDLGIPCPGDINDDGEVGIDDLLALIGAWDTNDPDADLNNDGIVDIEDLLLLISSFGACP